MEIKVGYYLSDLTEKNSGEICLVPGSHNRPPQELRDLKYRVPEDQIKPLHVRANTAMLWRTQVWHCVTPNLSNRVRKVFYVGYHLVEAYLIVPRVYGQRLRLSTLAVLLALMAGTTLQGLIGAVLVLPLVAAYPIIERIWLARYLGSEVLKDHRALAKADEPGNEDAVDTVLQGERHPWEGPSSAQTRRSDLARGRDGQGP